MAKYSIGLDFGTNSVRAIVVNVANGKEVGSAVWNYSQGTSGVILGKDPHIARQHPADYVQGTERTIKAALAAQAWKKDAYSWSNDTQVTIGPEWKQYELVFKFPSESEPGYKPEMKGFYLRFDLREESGTLWVDDVCLKEAVALDEWESWRATGQDQHSLVADPMFVDPEKDDYRLKPDSPAFKLGFQAIPVEKIGPYQDEMRASWPIVEAEGVREKPMGVQETK